jgi:hypothetical protein
MRKVGRPGFKFKQRNPDQYSENTNSQIFAETNFTRYPYISNFSFEPMLHSISETRFLVVTGQYENIHIGFYIYRSEKKAD